MLNFVFIKSINMILNGTRGIVLAVLLGPKSYGLFGTLVVVQQYLSYVALGMREGVAIRLAQSGDAQADRQSISSSAVFWGLCTGSLCAVAGVTLYLGEMLPRYAIWVGLIALCSIVNEILININRHENRLVRIASLEFIYHGSALLLVLLMWSRTTVEAALQAILIGLLLSVAGYASTLRTMRWNAVSATRIASLIRSGFMPAVLSAVVIVCNTFFIMAANWLRLGSSVGLVVLAGNISMLMLFGLNTVAWALASKSMQRLYLAPADLRSKIDAQDLGEILLHFGVVVAVLCALGTEVAFSFVLTQYAGSSIYILYFCLFQSYGLILFGETNFLNVNSRVRPVIAGYTMMLLSMIVTTALADLSFLRVIQLAVVMYFALAMAISYYARRLGFSVGNSTRRIALLCFPVVCAVTHEYVGAAGAMAVCILVLLAMLFFHGRRAFAYIGARGFR